MHMKRMGQHGCRNAPALYRSCFCLDINTRHVEGLTINGHTATSAHHAATHHISTHSHIQTEGTLFDMAAIQVWQFTIQLLWNLCYSSCLTFVDCKWYDFKSRFI